MSQNPSTSRRALVGESLMRPSMLIWVLVIPQVVLMILNLRGYDLVAGEMSDSQRQTSKLLFAYACLLLVLGTSLFVYLRTRKHKIAWAWNWLILVLHIGYLWYFSFQLHQLLPRSVTLWILPPERLLYYQFALMMPAIFYAAVRIACFPAPYQTGADVGITLAAAVGVPVLYYLFITVMAQLLDFFTHVSGSVVFLIFVAGTFVTLAGMIRLLVMLYNLLHRKGPIGMIVLTVLVGLVMPICGLLLNRAIPFPVDFQSIAVYVLAVLNGVVLLIPSTGRPAWDRMSWLAKCFMFPFTFYFFMVFLPFLPLALLAIIAMGTGFLVLTPTILFIIHARTIAEGLKCASQPVERWVAVGLMSAAMLIMPGYYTMTAKQDQHALRLAIDYVYSPDFSNKQSFGRNPANVRRSLERLRDFKAGLQLPFLTGYYNWIVFGGLVLPDEKMNHIHRVFFGEDLEPADEDLLASDLFGRGRGRRSWTTRTMGSPPPTENVKLSDLAYTVTEDAHANKALLSITMTNQAHSQSEYATSIALPEGVLVSGYWLYIGEERVPGRIFEKKTALWVYRMIRDVTRRDPGLLIYKDFQNLDFRVFPFESKQTRRVELELTYPRTFKPLIRIDDRTLLLATGPEPSRVTEVNTDRGTLVFAPKQAISKLPSLTRKPYLHFILDRSRQAGSSLRQQVNRCELIARKFPGIEACMISVANFEVITLPEQRIPVDEIHAVTGRLRLKKRGGFIPERAIKHRLAASADDPTEGRWLRYPIFIAVKDPASLMINETRMEPFDRLIPDIDLYYVSPQGDDLTAKRFDGKAAKTNDAPPPRRKVVLFKKGNRVQPCPVDRHESHLAPFFEEENVPLTVYNPKNQSFEPVPELEQIPADITLGQGARAWLENMRILFNPSLSFDRLASIIGLSRTSGVLVPAASYIVVENSAQWKMLERKEKQKLQNAETLEFMETPEPGLWVLVLGLMVVIALRFIFNRFLCQRHAIGAPRK